MDEVKLLARLGAAIRERRLQMALSQDDFADRIGMHRSYYSSIERGERNLTIETLNRVAVGLGAKPSQLLLEAGQ